MMNRSDLLLASKKSLMVLMHKFELLKKPKNIEIQITISVPQNHLFFKASIFVFRTIVIPDKDISMANKIEAIPKPL